MTVPIDSKGKFHFKLPISYTQNFTVEYGEIATLLCIPEKQFEIEIAGGILTDKKKIRDNNEYFVKVISPFQKETNELVIKFFNQLPAKEFQYDNYYKNLVQKEPKDYLDYIKYREGKYREFLESFIKNNTYNQTFNEWAYNYISYESSHDLLYYTWYHPTKNNINLKTFNIPEEYINSINTFNHKNPQIFSLYFTMYLEEYANFLLRSQSESWTENAMQAYEQNGIQGLFKIYSELFESTTPGLIKDYLYTKFFTDLFRTMPEDFNKIYSDQRVKTPLLRNILKNLMETNKATVPKEKGDIEQIESETSFNDIIQKYKGNIIYIDLWAPWCEPCLNEMPFSKELQVKLDAKNITFLFLAVNTQEGTWKSTIDRLGLKGKHILLSKDQYNLIAAKFNIQGIPRYLIIGKDGEIINSNAPSPSSSTIYEILKNLSE
ncbi:TlpA family protein disulfide reductase [Sphingobacterium puteale]|uniref:TlpA family protein disulfide reductase n=1 Tax=Sphingobacterium puteale TaxID=2420510 RepID=UPI0015FEC310|nr:TlpA disulfide reductase family protein [Sphingobacterium puteale]